MDQQTWVITFHTDSAVETKLYIDEFNDLLQDISLHVKVTVIHNKTDTQASVGDIIIALLPSSVIIAAINAIKQFFLRNHQNNVFLELEIKEVKFKGTISPKDYQYTLDKLLKYAQSQGKEEK